MEPRSSTECDPGTALVPVSTVGAEHLHRLMHRAASRSKSVEDWWENSLGTALAAVARARHSSGSRDEAERALDRLLRWWRDENPRRISRDVTALALGARAAADLQQSDPKLLEDAIAAVDDLARRDPTAVPMLHIALSAWALDGLIPDRDERPWPALRDRLAVRASGGVDEPLRIYASAVAAKHFDPNALVQSLYSAIGASPSASDACVLLWLITAAVERLSLTLDENDNALQLLIQRRAAIVERLVGDVDDDTFLPPELEDFGEPIPDNLPAISFLSSFEALLVDLALASPEEAEPWLTFPEAKAMFGKREKTLESELDELSDRTHLREACFFAIVGLIGGLAVWLGLVRIGWMTAIAESLAVTTVAIGALIVALKGRAGGLPEKLMEVLGLLFGTIAVTAIVNAFLRHYKSSRVSETDLVAGGVVAVIVFGLWAVGTFVIKKDPRHSE